MFNDSMGAIIIPGGRFWLTQRLQINCFVCVMVLTLQRAYNYQNPSCNCSVIMEVTRKAITCQPFRHFRINSLFDIFADFGNEPKTFYKALKTQSIATNKRTHTDTATTPFWCHSSWSSALRPNAPISKTSFCSPSGC